MRAERIWGDVWDMGDVGRYRMEGHRRVDTGRWGMETWGMGDVGRQSMGCGKTGYEGTHGIWGTWTYRAWRDGDMGDMGMEGHPMGDIGCGGMEIWGTWVYRVWRDGDMGDISGYDVKGLIGQGGQERMGGILRGRGEGT